MLAPASSSSPLLGLVVFGLGFAACAWDPNGTIDPSTRSSTTTGTGGGTGATGGAGGTGGMGGATSASTGAGGQGGGVTPFPPVCGNGKMDLGEECDDKNTAPADGCSANCLKENPDNCDGVTIKLTKGSSFQINNATVGADDDVQYAANVDQCNGGGPFGGGDLVYTVIPQESGTLVASLSADYSNHWLHARTACPGATTDEVGCDFSNMKNTPDLNTFGVTGGTRYYLFVDGHSGNNNEGTFTLKIELQ